MMRDAESTIGKIIDKQTVAFIGSIDDEGFPNVKAMLKPRKREGIKFVFFSTNTSSRRVAQFLKNPKTCLYFYDKRFFRGVMLRGTMEVLKERQIKEEIWQEGDTLYYPKGIDDPDYCVLRFTSQSGRYYSAFKSEDFEINAPTGSEPLLE